MSQRVSGQEAVDLAEHPRTLVPTVAVSPGLTLRGSLEGSRYLLKGSLRWWRRRIECAMSRLGRARATRGMRKA